MWNSSFGSDTATSVESSKTHFRIRSDSRGRRLHRPRRGHMLSRKDKSTTNPEGDQSTDDQTVQRGRGEAESKREYVPRRGIAAGLKVIDEILEEIDKHRPHLHLILLSLRRKDFLKGTELEAGADKSLLGFPASQDGKPLRVGQVMLADWCEEVFRLADPEWHSGTGDQESPFQKLRSSERFEVKKVAMEMLMIHEDFLLPCGVTPKIWHEWITMRLADFTHVSEMFLSLVKDEDFEKLNWPEECGNMEVVREKKTQIVHSLKQRATGQEVEQKK